MFVPLVDASASGMSAMGICLLVQFMLLSPALGAEPSPSDAQQFAAIIEKMKAAYAQVEDYQIETEVRVYRKGQVVETERFLYTFKKPNHIRIDVKSPNSGTVLVYPDKDGKVVVKPGGWVGFLKLHLSPGSALFRSSDGQRIDQTSMGLLIQNIARSLTDLRHGEIKLSEQNGRVILEVLAEDHFLANVLTRYQFYIDETRWLPVEVREFTSDGILKRAVMFRNLRTSTGISDSFFKIDRENPEHGQPSR